MLSEQNRITVNIEDEMRKSYMDYAMSVIVGRALPDVRDGLKPVHRRVLFAMNELSNDYNKPYKKSARVVGDVIARDGDLIVLGDAGKNFANYLIRGNVYIRGEWESLGNNTSIIEMDETKLTAVKEHELLR